MEKNPDEIPLQEVLYKPTTTTNEGFSKLGQSRKSKVWFLYLAAFTADLVGFTAGLSFSWTSPVLPKLNGRIDPENNPLGRPVTPTEESWIASFLGLGSIFGPLIAGRLSDRIGRKRTLLVIAGPMIISLAMSAYANSVPLFYVARLLLGISAGSVFAVLPIYLHEISENHNRGAIIGTMGISVPAGLLYGLVVGPYLSVRNFCLACLLPPTFFVPVFAIFFPESPHFLAAQGDQRGVEESLIKLRQRSKDQIQDEASSILKAAEKSGHARGTIKEIFQSKSTSKAFIIVLTLLVLQQCSGVAAVISYMQSIFEAANTGLKAELCAVLVGVVQVIATIIASLLVDRLGRKVLVIVSTVGSGVGLVCLGLYFYLKKNNFDVSAIGWLPISSLIIFMSLFNFGLGPLPWTILAEMFPQNIKSVSSTLCSVICFFVGFVVTLFFPPLSLILGLAQSFWIFSLVCFGGTIFVLVMLPETKGKTLQEIQLLLEK